MHIRTNRLFGLLLAVALLVLPAQSQAVNKLAMRVVDANGTPLVGESTIPGYAGWIAVTTANHAVSVPIGSNGQPSGPAETSPLSVSTVWDQATLQMFQAQASGSPFQSVTVEVIDDPTAKMPMPLIRFELLNANISSLSYGFVENSPYFDVLMNLSFSQITITDIAAGTTATYSWNPFSSAAPPPQDKGIVLGSSPNPTHGRTEFRFALPQDANARLALFDLRGYLVRELHSGWTSSESNVAVWDGTDNHGLRVAQGVYVARLTYPGREVTQRITVLR